MWKNILFFQISNFNLNGPLSFGLLFPEFLSCQSEKKKDFSRQLETDAIWLCTKVVSIVYERRKVHDRDIGWHYLGLGVLFKVGCVWLQLWRGSVVAWHFEIGPAAPIDQTKCQMILQYYVKTLFMTSQTFKIKAHLKIMKQFELSLLLCNYWNYRISSYKTLPWIIPAF